MSRGGNGNLKVPLTQQVKPMLDTPPLTALIVIADEGRRAALDESLRNAGFIVQVAANSADGLRSAMKIPHHCSRSLPARHERLRGLLPPQGRNRGNTCSAPIGSSGREQRVRHSSGTRRRSLPDTSGGSRRPKSSSSATSIRWMAGTSHSATSVTSANVAAWNGI